MIFEMQPIEIAILVPLLLLSLTAHEWAHGKVAFLHGDPTATEAGRLTLNPIKHIDPVGLLILLMVGVGWAKPVPVDTQRLRRPRRDLILVSLAGPGANLSIALFFALLGVLVLQIGFDIPVIPFRALNSAILGFIGG